MAGQATPRITTAEYEVLDDLHHWQGFTLDATEQAGRHYETAAQIWPGDGNTDGAKRSTFSRLIGRGLIERVAGLEQTDGRPVYRVTAGAVAAWYERMQAAAYAGE